MGEFICIGHRGASGHLPENTLAAFARAVEMGCPWVELDVYNVDRELIVIHDDDLERTTNGKGKVMAATLDYLRSLDAGAGQQIPTLLEVVELIARRAIVNVELKGPDTAAPVTRLLNELTGRGWSTDDFLLSSFDHSELGCADPRYRRGALFGRPSADMFDIARNLDAWSVNLSLRSVHSELVDEAHANGFKVLVYTVDAEADIARMMDLGIEGVFTNFPERVFSVVAARGDPS